MTAYPVLDRPSAFILTRSDGYLENPNALTVRNDQHFLPDIHAAPKGWLSKAWKSLIGYSAGQAVQHATTFDFAAHEVRTVIRTIHRRVSFFGYSDHVQSLTLRSVGFGEYSQLDQLGRAALKLGELREKHLPFPQHPTL